MTDASRMTSRTASFASNSIARHSAALTSPSDPNRQGTAASGNLNRIYLCGMEAGLQPDGLDRLIELFAAAGVKRFFVWLSPGPDMAVVRGWLKARGSPVFDGRAIRRCAAAGMRRFSSKPISKSGR
jgi:hypothetical protein